MVGGGDITRHGKCHFRRSGGTFMHYFLYYAHQNKAVLYLDAVTKFRIRTIPTKFFGVKLTKGKVFVWSCGVLQISQLHGNTVSGKCTFITWNVTKYIFAVRVYTNEVYNYFFVGSYKWTLWHTYEGHLQLRTCHSYWWWNWNHTICLHSAVYNVSIQTFQADLSELWPFLDGNFASQSHDS